MRDRLAPDSFFGDHHQRLGRREEVGRLGGLRMAAMSRQRSFSRILHLSSPTALTLTTVLFAGIGCGGEETAGEWPQFRGEDTRGVFDTGTLPTYWSKGSDNILWRSEVPGRGNSSPVVSDGRVFLTTAERDPETPEGERRFVRAVLAYDLETGERLWRRDLFSAPPDEGHRLSTDAAPTPVTDGERLYVYFGAVLAALTHDGELLWKKEVDPTYSEYINYGAASSPILVDDKVLLVQDQEGFQSDDVGWMAAYDRETGEEVWRREWDETCCSYSTPLYREREGTPELLFAYSGKVAAHDPETGEILWEQEYPMWQFVGALVGEGDLLCALGGAHRQRGNVCMRLEGTGRDTRVEELWFEPRRAPETASAILYRGKVYAVTQGGVMSAYDARTGEEVFVARLEEGRGYRSSPVAGDGKVYAQANTGQTAVIDAGADGFSAIAYNDLEDGANNASPAISSHCLLLRTQSKLYCIGQEECGGGTEAAG